MKALLKFSLKNILFVILLAPVFCFSQKPVLGIKVGLALANSTFEYANQDNADFYKNSTRTGILAGVYVDIPSGKKLIVRPGAELVSKGTMQVEYSYGGYPLKFTYIDFPINFLYKTSCMNGHLIAGGGPSIGFPIKEPYSAYQLKTEFGINGLIGYEMPVGFSLNLNYNYGLSNASKERDYLKKISNRYLGITMGYSF